MRKIIKRLSTNKPSDVERIFHLKKNESIIDAALHAACELSKNSSKMIEKAKKIDPTWGARPSLEVMPPKSKFDIAMEEKKRELEQDYFKSKFLQDIKGTGKDYQDLRGCKINCVRAPQSA